MRHITTRQSYTHTLQASHAHIGEYYAAFNIPETIECPCGTTVIQTRAHIFRECPLFTDHRRILRKSICTTRSPSTTGHDRRHTRHHQTHRGLQSLLETTPNNHRP